MENFIDGLKVVSQWTGEEVNVWLQIGEYEKGGVSLQLWCDEGPYATLSVNLGKVKKGQFFVDTNNCPWAPKWLEENAIAKPLDKIARSGFCWYPLYKLCDEMC